MLHVSSGKPLFASVICYPTHSFPLYPIPWFVGILSHNIYILDSILYTLLLQFKYIPVVIFNRHPSNPPTTYCPPNHLPLDPIHHPL